jgi:hypothetical protein
MSGISGEEEETLSHRTDGVMTNRPGATALLTNGVFVGATTDGNRERSTVSGVAGRADKPLSR